MKVEIYTVLDKLAQESGGLFTARNDAVAHREYKALIQRSTTAGRPEEYRLLHIGSYDHERCVIEAYDVPVDITPALVPVSEVEE